MGVHIDAFAVDTVALAALLEQPVWHVLTGLRLAPPGEDVLFSIYRPQPRTRYVVTPDRRILKVMYDIGSRAALNDAQLAADENLQQTAGDYLATQSSYELSFLLRGTSLLAGEPIAQGVTDGYKRWWIGSLLGAAQALWHDGPLSAELAAYLARILRDWDCGFALNRVDYRPSAGDLPVMPAQDIDYRMAVLGPGDCLRFIELLDVLVQCQPTFQPPPLCAVASDDPTEWNEWVLAMIGRFRRIRQFGLPNLHLVSFIG